MNKTIKEILIDKPKCEYCKVLFRAWDIETVIFNYTDGVNCFYDVYFSCSNCYKKRKMKWPETFQDLIKKAQRKIS